MKISKKTLELLIREEFKLIKEAAPGPGTKLGPAKKAQVVLDKVLKTGTANKIFAAVKSDPDAAAQLVAYFASVLGIDASQMGAQTALRTQAKKIGADKPQAGQPQTPAAANEVVDPTADPELADPQAGSSEAEEEEKARELAEKDPAALKATSAISSVKDKQVYAEVLKNVLLGSRLSASDKLEAFQQLFGEREGASIYDAIKSAAPGIAK